MALLAGATVIATYKLGRRAFPPEHSREMAAWSALLLALSPLFFAQSTMPEEIAQASSHAYQQPGAAAVAIRSSATTEDLAGASFAGMHESYLTQATDPGWTPVFPLVSGIVLEIGGQLSHGAIVAREYAIPAVVNVQGALHSIKDGQTIVVDGTTGRVYLDEVETV